MPIHRLLENSAFSPEEIASLVAAYDATVRHLRAAEFTSHISNEVVASTIIEIAKSGVRNAATLAEKTVTRPRGETSAAK